MFKVIITEREPQGNEKRKKSYGIIEKFKIGCQAVAGIPVDAITGASGMSRAYVYQQKEKVESYADAIAEQPKRKQTIEITEGFKKRLILSLALDCCAPFSGIQRVFETVLGQPISTGYISGVINEASKRAQIYDDGLSLEGISQGANDEIFQGDTPILTGIDPESTYVYLLEEASDRTADTWEIYMRDRKDHGLELKTSISDNGAGLLCGIPRVYPEMEIQGDTFHALYAIGKEVAKVERKTYASLKQEYALKERAEGKRPGKDIKEKLEESQTKAEEMVKTFDLISILFGWLRELLGFSGYSVEDVTKLIQYVLEEIEKHAGCYPGLLKEVEKTRGNLPKLLSFIGRLEREIGKHALELGIPPDAFHLIYQQMSYRPGCEEIYRIDQQLADLLTNDYNVNSIRSEFFQLLKGVKKASSLVENLNGRIRDYIEMKRIVPTRFFVLMKVYFNTRRYKRSRCAERIGKSPLELLTGKLQPEFLEALGY